MIAEFCEWLAATALSQRFQSALWFVPVVQTVHILAIAIVVTLLAMLDLRVLGVTSRGPYPAQMARGFLPWVWRALLVLLVSGVLLAIAEPSRELQNALFWVKMLLVLGLVGVTLGCASLISKDTADPGSAPSAPSAAGRILGAVSLALLVAIVAAGRWIAYV